MTGSVEPDAVASSSAITCATQTPLADAVTWNDGVPVADTIFSSKHTDRSLVVPIVDLFWPTIEKPFVGALNVTPLVSRCATAPIHSWFALAVVFPLATFGLALVVVAFASRSRFIVRPEYSATAIASPPALADVAWTAEPGLARTRPIPIQTEVFDAPCPLIVTP